MQAIVTGVTAGKVHTGRSAPQIFLSTYLGQDGASRQAFDNEHGPEQANMTL